MSHSQIPAILGNKSLSVPALPAALSESVASVTPRSGGYLRNKSQTSLAAIRSKNINDSLKEKPFTLKKSVGGKADDTEEMLAITISCVMMMAANATYIPDEYFIWAENYLSRVKDENGKLPPNINGILNHMAFIRSDITGTDVGICRCT